MRCPPVACVWGAAFVMDQRSFQRLLRRTVALPVVLLGLLAATLTGEILLILSSLHWVDHSDQVISNARQLMRGIVEMDNALRGYHLTGDRSFLDTYRDARSRVPDQMEVVTQLSADNPEQSERLRRLRTWTSAGPSGPTCRFRKGSRRLWRAIC